MDIDDRIGESGTWVLPAPDGDSITVKGRYLGMSSSYRMRHRMESHKESREWAAPGDRCSGCRWSEFRIFREDTDDELPYLLHKTGRTAVPGETSWFSYTEMLGVRSLMEAMTTRRKSGVFLSISAGRVLAQAAAFDEELKQAWDSRVVV